MELSEPEPIQKNRRNRRKAKKEGLSQGERRTRIQLEVLAGQRIRTQDAEQPAFDLAENDQWYEEYGGQDEGHFESLEIN